MQIKFDVFWKKNLGTLYKDNSIDVLGKEAIVDLDLREVSNIYVNFKVNDKSFTDLVEIVDIETSLIRIPFKTDVIKLGTNELELVATMKNGDVKPSQTFTYTVDKSLENPNAVEADTNYPVLIELLDLAGNKLIDMNESIQKVNTSIENMTNEISSYKEATTNALNSDISSYKETTAKELENNFNNYSSNTTLNINKVLDNKIVEVDNVVSIKSNELDTKFAAKSNEITKTLNDEIAKVDKTLNSEINKVNTTLTNKANEVDRVLENKVNEVDETLDTTVTTINAELNKKSLEVDNKVNAKIVEIDNRVNAKITDVNTSLNNKINEVNTSFNNKINEVNEVIEEVELSEQARKEEHTELVNELSSYSSDMNNVKDRVDVLEAKITDNEVIVDLKNKVNNHEERITTSEKTIRHQGILLKALNDLDDTISIEEEGTIISLPQSDDGKIIIDELQGNTLVNYCTNGSEELTLNNEINAQGTNITLTDTVDNGKVDVVCEGNTLLNLNKNIQKMQSKNFTNNRDNTYTADLDVNTDFIGRSVWCALETPYPFKDKTTYTVVLNIIENTLISSDETSAINLSNYTTGVSTTIPYNSKGLIIKTFTTNMSNLTPGAITNQWQIVLFAAKLTGGKITIKNPMLLEGDYTNKPIPSYFEGMKSAFELENNKVEIVGQNKNLFDKNSDINFTSSIGTNLNSYKQVEDDYIRFKYGGYGIAAYFTSNIKKLLKGTYTLSCECYLGSENSSKDISIGYRVNDNNRPASVYRFNSYNTWEKKNHTFTISEDTDIEGLMIQSSGSSQNYKNIDFRIKNIQLERNAQSTEYIPYSLNKKEIQLSEPLRGLPDGVCDKFVKQGGKWYVERNTNKVILDGSLNYGGLTTTSDELYSKCWLTDYKFPLKAPGFSNMLSNNRMTDTYYLDLPNGISGTPNNNAFWVSINKKVESVYEFKQELNNNPSEVIYELATPVYEEITDPQVITYLDTTHISTNSTIPCNMKITNSGYNAIIKPSTLYTVAFDTDKAGEVNVGLGGAKTSTTNNVATITTPSTLTDDSLRLYGKGIKASNVRLLEGDKANYIPSYFEGMKSCFEDKLQEDGSYEVGILSNNKNLFNENILEKVNSNYYEIINKDNRRCLKIERPSLMYKTRILNQLKKNTSYKISFDMLYDRTKGDGLAQGGSIHIVYTDGTSNSCYASTSYNEWLNASIITPLNKTIRYIQFSYGTNTPTYIDLDTFIVQENNNLVDYVPHKSNKIQLQLNEPLRAVGDVKDRFVLRDGKLMIERNCGEIVLDGSSDEGLFLVNSDVDVFIFGSNTIIKNSFSNAGIVSNNFPRNTNMYNDRNIGITLGTGGFLRICLGRIIDLKGFKQWLSENPTTIVYQLAEPTYEEVPYETQKLILECFENGTLFIDTLIPPTVSVTYSANKPVVAKLNQVDNTTNINTEDIAMTQMAVDFLLMSTLGEEMINFKIKGGTNMSAYFASRIIKGALKYEDVVNKYPNYKEDIDLILIAEGYSDLIVEL